MGDATPPLAGLRVPSSWCSWHQDRGLTPWTSGVVLPSTHIGQFILMLAMAEINLLLPISYFLSTGPGWQPLWEHTQAQV